MIEMARKRKATPKQTVVNAFVLFRVPRHGSISYSELYQALTADIEQAKSDGFHFDKWCRLSLDAALRFIFSRHLLSTSDLQRVLNATNQKNIGHVEVQWNERTERYVRRLPPRIARMMGRLPTSNILLLMAGAAKE